ncbi:MAG: hypothetical protein IH991_10890 [Planctomycetes bacterium]|nr:hypothetical protein [Planctomycetota bacterium]
MNDKHAKGKRNLIILSWMGLACQPVGLLFAIVFTIAAFADLASVSPLGGVVFLVFGMALSGWAGNLLEITDLKKRVSELEGCVSKDAVKRVVGH